MPTLLAIDQSTSATKALLFDEHGDVLAQASREHAQHYPQPGWVEHDADEIWRNTLAVAGELLRHPATATLGCVSLTNQRETVVVFERGTGTPLAPAIVWQDRRGDALCAELVRGGHEAAVRGKTGLRVDAYFSGSKLQWLVRNRPELARRLADGSALIGTIDAYLIYRLTGGTVFACDSTNASRTLLLDLTALRWDAALCELWQVPMRALPEVRPSAAQFGETTFAGLLARPVPICGVIGDSQASLFAQRCFEPGMAKATFGTGTSVLLNVGHRRPPSTGGCVAGLGWEYGGRPTFVLEGVITFSAATLVWLRDQLHLIADAAEAQTLAAEVPDNGGVFLVPAFSGLGAPHWRESARAAIVGLSAHSDRRHVARAALESIAFQVRDVLAMMRDEAGFAPTQLCADGGATANPLLMQLVTDLTRVDLRVARTAHGSALGAAMMGLLGTGRCASVAELPASSEPRAVYVPRQDPIRVASLVEGWHRAVRQVLTP